MVTEASDSTVSSGSVILYKGETKLELLPNVYFIYFFRIHQYVAALRRVYCGHLNNQRGSYNLMNIYVLCMYLVPNANDNLP